MPLTLDQLIAHLIEFRAAYPDQGHRPVHLLDMALDDGDGDGLVTAVDLDCFDEQRGPVISLLSGPMPETCPCGPTLSGAPRCCWRGEPSGPGWFPYPG